MKGIWQNLTPVGDASNTPMIAVSASFEMRESLYSYRLPDSSPVKTLRERGKEKATVEETYQKAWG